MFVPRRHVQRFQQRVDRNQDDGRFHQKRKQADGLLLAGKFLSPSAQEEQRDAGGDIICNSHSQREADSLQQLHMSAVEREPKHVQINVDRDDQKHGNRQHRQNGKQEFAPLIPMLSCLTVEEAG